MKNLLLLFALSSCLLVVAQPPEVTYPKGYFRNPLNIPISLSGNFGELRSNHYHMGLDLKTNARENLPVHAAADGYIARIKIEPGGFGRAIYINHPNGYTTLYAHLNNFAPPVEAWLKSKQYELESWNVALELSPDLFPVKKGQFIAYSGNTGGSQGPHVHFEIRRTADDVNVNPLLFGFPIADNVRPRILRLALYDRRKSVYEQAPKIFPLKATANGYTTTSSIITVSSPIVSMAVTAYDTHSGSSNLNGIYGGDLFVGNEKVIGFEMDNISYNDTRYLNAHIDYRYKSTGGAYLQHLSELPGYINSIYRQYSGNGVIDISDGEVHDLRIEVRDANENQSELSFRVKYVPGANSSNSDDGDGRMFYPLMLDGYETADCEFYIGEKCLYDSVKVRHRAVAASAASAVSSLHYIGASYIPLQESFLIRLRAADTLSANQRNKTVMQWISGTKKGVQKVDWQNEWASARFRDFGAFQLIVDSSPPEIVPVGFANGSDLSKATRIVFTVRDNLDRVKNVRAELNGNWLRFTNDKGRNFIYQFDEKCPRGSHVLKISAEDEAGNFVEREFKFTR